MKDLSQVKAGKYELVALRWDEPKSKPGEPFDFVRHHQGDVLDLNVENARRLVAAGAVVTPGEKQRAEEERARLAYEAARAQVPDTLRDDEGGADGSEVDPDNPGASGVKAVQAFLDTASDEDRERVLTAEEDGKNRKGVVEYEPKGSGE